MFDYIVDLVLKGLPERDLIKYEPRIVDRVPAENIHGGKIEIKGKWEWT